MKNYSLICHMLVSLDGRVTGGYLERPECEPYIEDYYRILEAYQGNNWICGRTTFAEFIPKTSELDLNPFAGQVVERTDFIADETATSFAIALDPSGKLGWTQAVIGEEFPQRQGDHIVTVLSEAVSDSYLAYLQSIGVSYIFAGQDRELDVTLILEKLHQYFKLDSFYLLGGGIINGAFAKAELVDEISMVLAPMIEGNSDSRALFEFGDHPYTIQSQYSLDDTIRLESGALHLTYRKNKKFQKSLDLDLV